MRYMSRLQRKHPRISCQRICEPLERRALLSATLTSLASFDSGSESGASGLIADASGVLYGTTNPSINFSAYSNQGVAYEVNPLTNSLTTIANISNTDGSDPLGLIVNGSGILYGSDQFSDIYSIDPATSSIDTVTGFNQSANTGVQPNGKLVFDASGNLYGTTEGNGNINLYPNINGYGSIFELNPSTNTVTTLFTFNGTNGISPRGGLITDTSGNLYGMTSNGYDTIFEFTPSSNTFTTLATLHGQGQNIYDNGDLVMDGNNNELYGTTNGLPNTSPEGSENTIFSLDLNTDTLSTIRKFSGEVVGSLVVDDAGNLYGTLNGNGPGTVFELSGPNHDILTTLATFNTITSGYAPNGLVMDSSGVLYGTTTEGGAYGNGTFFEISGINSASQTLVYSQEPSNAVVGTKMKPPISLDIDDENGQTVANDNSTVTLSVQSGPQGGTLGGTTSVAAVDGVATFSDLTLSVPGTYVLTASDTTDGLTVNSDSFTVVAPVNPPFTDALGPADDAAPGPIIPTLTPTFYWEATTGVSGYGLYVKDLTTNALVYPNASGTTSTPLTGTSFALPNGYLQSGHSYEWYMTSFSGSVEMTTDSSLRYFQTQGPTPSQIPDLAPSNVTLSAYSGQVGSSFTVSWTMANIGNADAAATVTGIRLGSSSTSEDGVDLIQGYPTPEIGAGQSVSQSTSVKIPNGIPAGTYFIWIIADNSIPPMLDDGNTANDYAVSAAFTVTAQTTPEVNPGNPPATAAITRAAPSQQVLTPGGILIMNYTIDVPSAGPLLLGATIETSNGGNAVNLVPVSSDPSGTGDQLSPLLQHLTPGDNYFSQDYILPNTSAVGAYSLINQLWTDADGTGEIDVPPDARVGSAVTTALNITAPALSPLLNVNVLGPNWNQTNPYNEYVPVDPESSPSGQRSDTGCVATAIAQVLYYWKVTDPDFQSTPISFTDADGYPSTEGTTDIQIFGDSEDDLFPSADQLTTQLAQINYNENTAANFDAKAVLSFAAGVAVKMDYSSNESGAKLYPQSFAKLGFPSASESPDWVAIEPFVISDIANGEPVVIGITDNRGDGHCVVLDGYDSARQLFHVDLGWGPDDYGSVENSSNDWFSLTPGNVLINAGGYIYSAVTTAIYNIVPTVGATGNVSASQGTYSNYVSLSWDATPDAVAYQIWRNTSNDPSTATMLTPTSIIGDSYDDTAAIPGQTYYYWVQPVSQIGTGSLGTAVVGSVAASSQLTVSQQPASGIANQKLPAVQFVVDDQFGNPIDGTSVTLSLASGPYGATLGGTLIVPTVDGIASFDDLTVDRAGSYTFMASDGNLPSVTTDSFTVTYSGPQLVFAQQSTTATAGAKTLSFSIVTDDTAGNILTGKTKAKVTLKIASGPSGAKILGSIIIPVKSGHANFSKLAFQKAGTYTLEASASGFGPAISDSFVVSPAAAIKMLFSQQPASVTVNTPFSTEVELMDRYGNLATDDDSSVVVSLGTHPKSSSLGGVTTAQVAGGLADFDSLLLNESGSYSLNAIDDKEHAVSAKFVIS